MTDLTTSQDDTLLLDSLLVETEVSPDEVTVTAAAAAAVELGEPESLPLEELDGLLDPLRRVVAFATRPDQADAGAPRYFAVNAARWLTPTLKLDLPTSVRALLVDATGQLADFETLDAATKRERMSVIAQIITRLDALLGLPLRLKLRRPRPRPRRATPAAAQVAEAPAEASPVAEDEPSERSSSRRSDGRRNRRGRDRERPPAVVVPVAPVEPPPPVSRWLHDPEVLGRSLDDMGLPEPLLEALGGAGVCTPADLMLLAPVGEELVRPVHGAGRDIEPGRAAIGGRVGARFTTVFPGGRRVTEVRMLGAGPARAQWRTSPAPAWLLDQLKAGRRVVLVGDWVVETDAEGRSYGVLVDPELAADDGHKGARLMQYNVDGVDDRIVRTLVRWMLPQVQEVRDYFARDLLTRHALLPLAEAIHDAHMKGAGRPEARARLAFEEAFFASLGLSIPRAQRGRGHTHVVSHDLVARLCQTNEIQLTDAQQLAFEEIKRDLVSSSPMLRRITGEAGSGKGLLATLAMVLVAATKAQVLFLAPDALAAQQRLLYLEPLLREVGLVARFVDATPSAGQLDAIRRGEVHVVVGAPGLIQANIGFRRLGLVVCEETTEYGAIGERVEALGTPRPDLLVIGAIPLPVQIGLPAYAGYDLSLVQADPPRETSGQVFDADQRDQAYEAAVKVVAEGMQAVVVFPVIRGVDALDVREALQVRAALEEEAFKGYRVSLFHGAMTKEERHRVIEDFASHRSEVLVATAPLEGCPPIRGLGAVILEQADRTSPQRLYRLRGLLNHGNAAREGQCLFVLGTEPDPAGVAWVRRVAASREGMDVFVDDLREHGANAFVFEGCPPGPSFAWLDPDADTEVLLAAHREARAMLAADVTMRRANGPELMATLDVRAANLLGRDVSPLAAGAGKGAGATAGRRRRRRRKKR